MLAFVFATSQMLMQKWVLYPISNGASQMLTATHMLNSQCEQALCVHCTKICNVTNANAKCKQALRLCTYIS